MAASQMTLSSDLGGQQTQRIWLEVGHTYEPRYWQSGRAVPEDWRVWIRGVAGADISALVDRVVFELGPDSKRINLEAPYQHEGAGSAPEEVVVDVHLTCATRPEQFQVIYGPLFRTAGERSAGSKLVFYDVRNPSSQLLAMKAKHQSSGSVEVQAKESHEPEEPKLTHKQALLFEPCDICDRGANSGGAICPKLAPSHNRVEPDLKSEVIGSSEPSKVEENSLYEFVEPIDPRSWESLKLPDQKRKARRRSQSLKGDIEPYPRATQRNGPHVEIPLRRPCSAQGKRRKSKKLLSWPPLPELPAALRRALEATPAQLDYALQ